MRISDWSSDVCSSDLSATAHGARQPRPIEDEAHPRDQIGERHPGIHRIRVQYVPRSSASAGRHFPVAARHDTPACAGVSVYDLAAGRSFFLYIASIRAVTAKPPKMLTLASATAISPSHFEPVEPAAALAISAPTKIGRAHV